MLRARPMLPSWLFCATLRLVCFAQSQELGDSEDLNQGSVISDEIASSTSTTTFFANPTNNPSNDEFNRRAFFKGAVIGDYIYFDGGQGSQYDTERSVYPVNATLSIDLSNSWNIDDVEIIEKSYASEDSLPALGQALMVDSTRDAFYIWGGSTPNNASVASDAEVWMFSVDDNGGGEWQGVTPQKKSNEFFAIKRSSDASLASTRDAGFIFGGKVTKKTETEADAQGGAGYRIFNFTDHKWFEDRVVPYAENNFLEGGSAVFAPGFGPNGLIFLLGGFSDSSDPKTGLGFQIIWFMDPIERKWYSQEASGKIPSSRAHTCSVGVAASDGRFDIFMFGGDNLGGLENSDVYVLTLPGFQWQIARSSLGQEFQRSNHVCGVVGQRQLLSFGGVKTTDASGNYVDPDEYWRVTDPWTQGIGIFDMSSWTWEGRFDADADGYEQNEKLRDWYDAGNLDDVKWSKDVKALFVSSNETDHGNGSGSDAGGDGDGDGDGDSDGDSSSKVGVIAGSAVGGVVVIAALIAAFFLWRRSQRRKAAVVTGQSIHSPPSMQSTQPKAGSHGVSYHQGSGHYGMAPNEMPTRWTPPSELDASRTVPYELAGSGGRRH